MKVFLIILAVIAAVIALICCILSVKVKLWFDYKGKVYLKLQWAFIKIDLLPAGNKKQKKAKQPKEKPKKEEPKPPEENKPKQKKPNPIKTFLSNEGIQGLFNILYQTCAALGGFFGKIVRKLKIEELFFDMRVATGDAAQTALEYGKICSVVFPMLGYICSHMRIGKYDADISPDYLANHTDGELHAIISFKPIVLTNASVGLVFTLLFKVVLQFLKGLKTPKDDVKATAQSTVNNNSNINQNEGGAL